MEFKDLLKTRRNELKLTLEDIGKVVGVSKATVQRWESGDIKNVRRDKIALLAKALHTSPLYLMGLEDDSTVHKTETYPFKIQGEIAAGYDTFPNGTDAETIEIPVEWLHGLSPDNFFVLKVKGDSMSPEIEDGDLVLVHEENTVDPGTIAAVLYDSDYATLKKVNYNPKERWWMDLIPLNRNYEILHVVNEDLNRCKVLGPVWKLIRDFE